MIHIGNKCYTTDENGKLVEMTEKQIKEFRNKMNSIKVTNYWENDYS